MRSSTSLKFCSGIFALICLVFSGSVYAQPSQGIFGYWANLNPADNDDHTNVTVPFIGHADEATATTDILQELSAASSQGVQVILFVKPFLFESPVDSNGFMKQNSSYTLDPNATSQFNSLVQTLKSNGYLVPNDPSSSTVLAFGIVDEPELHGLKDQGGSAHPALQSAINVVQNHPDTSSFPTYINVHHNWGDAAKGVRLSDWASTTDYWASTSGYISHFLNFTNHLLSGQKAILLPQASYGGSLMNQYGPWHDPDQIFDRFADDSRIIGIIPFLWSHADTDGVTDIPSLKTAWTNYGKQIKLDSIVDVSVNCYDVPPSWENFECYVNASGGTGGYSYDWSNGETGTLAEYSLQCPHPQSGTGSDVSEQVEVIVTDNSGRYRIGTDVIQCP